MDTKTNNFALDALEKATIQLEAGINRAKQNPEDDMLRDAVIQRFEYTMDLSWKLLQRYLKYHAKVDDMDIRSRKDLFRESAKLKIIDDAESWILHYGARNSTSHDYDEAKANPVYARALLFLPDVKKLIEVLASVS